MMLIVHMSLQRHCVISALISPPSSLNLDHADWAILRDEGYRSGRERLSKLGGLEFLFFLLEDKASKNMLYTVPFSIIFSGKMKDRPSPHQPWWEVLQILLELWLPLKCLQMSNLKRNTHIFLEFIITSILRRTVVEYLNIIDTMFNKMKNKTATSYW